MKDVMEKSRRVADSSTALRMTGDKAVQLALSGGFDTSKGITLQVWVVPSATARGITAYSKENLGGTGQAFKAGLYDDLSIFPVWRNGIGSLRIPPGYVAVVFDQKHCAGKATVLTNDRISVEPALAKAAKSLFVIDPADTNPSHVVGAFEDEQGPCSATMLPLGRYEELAKTDDRSFAVFLIPPGLGVTLYSKPRCQGTALELADLESKPGDWTPSSMAVTRCITKTPKQADVAKVLVFTDANGIGLDLKVHPPDNPVAPPTTRFAGQSLRPNRWHHLARTFDGKHVLSYIDGQLVEKADDVSVPALDDQMVLGQRLYGDLSTLAIYRGAFAQPQIAENRYLLAETNNPDLIECWPLNGSGPDQITALKSGDTVALPKDEAFWVVANLPMALMDSTVARRIVHSAQERVTAHERALHKTQIAKIKKAQERADAALRLANAKAETLAFASHVKTIQGLERWWPVVKTADGQDASRFELNSESSAGVNVRDFAINAATGDRFLAVTDRWEWSSNQTGEGKAYYHPHKVIWVTQSGQDITVATSQAVICALAVDPSGLHGNPILYYAEADGWFTAVELGEQQVIQPTRLANLAPSYGAQGEWAMTVDQTRKRLIWTNGHEIWQGSIQSENSLYGYSVLVPHGVSPNPIAVAVDDQTGDVIWIDGELGKVRKCALDGSKICELYDAPDPAAGIAIDYFDVSSLQDEAKGEQVNTHKRVYWNSKHHAEVVAMIVDEPGPFCDLHNPRTRKLDAAKAPAADLVQLAGTSWQPHVETPRPFSAEDKYEDKGADKKDVKFGNYLAQSWLDDEGNRMGIVLFYEFGSYFLEGFGYQKGRFLRPQIMNFETGNTELVHSWNDFSRGETPQVFAFNPRSRRFLYGGYDWTAITQYRDDQDPHWTPSSQDVRLERIGDAWHQQFAKGNARRYFSEDGRYVVATSDQNEILVWNSETGHYIHIMAGHTNQVSAFATYESGSRQFVLSGSYDNTIRCWDLDAGNCQQVFRGHTRLIMDLHINSDASRCISSSFDHTAKIWDMPSGACLQTLIGHDDALTTAILHPDGHRAITASYDKTVKVWDIQSGHCLRTIQIAETPSHLTLRENGQDLIVSHNDTIEIWDLDLHPFVLGFDGKDSVARIDPVYLNFHQGFGVEMQLCARLPDQGNAALLSLGAEGQDQIDLTMDEKGNLSLTIKNRAGSALTLKHMQAPLQNERWHTLTVSISAEGWATIQIDDGPVTEGQVGCPAPALRTANAIGQADGPRRLHPFCGEISMARLWNRALTDDEITQFHQRPMKAPNVSVPDYVRTVTTAYDPRTYLMAGMADGSTPAVPMFEFATDKGLYIESSTSTAHAKLLAAQQIKIEVDRDSANRRKKAEEDAASRKTQAYLDHEGSLRQASARLEEAKAETARILAPAQAKVASAKITKQNTIDQAKQKKKADIEAATRAKAEKVGDATAQAKNIKNAANRALREAQARKDQA